MRRGINIPQLEGVITFRGNNFRDSPSYGTASMTEKKFDTCPMDLHGGQHAEDVRLRLLVRLRLDGQPLLVRWPESTKRIMNMRDWAKQRTALWRPYTPP